jgi:dTDP-4-amino-4,6-dideoxygalactose transaminase
MRIHFGTIHISEYSKILLMEVLESGRLSSGRYVREFEKRVADLIGVREAVAVSSGTDADTLALAALYDFGAKRGDEVIIPALSFVATGNAVLHAGFTPVFVDIDRNTLNIDPEKIEPAVTEKTVAIMPVHLMGKPADMDRISEIAQKFDLFVIEDAAEAWGAVYKGKNVGSLGDLSAFSLYVAHILTTVEGGIILTDRSDLAEVLRSLRCHGRACKCDACVLNLSGSSCRRRFDNKYNQDMRFVFERVGYSSKMNELEAAIGLGNLEDFEMILQKRRRNLKNLMEKFERFEEFMISIKEAPYERIGPHAFPIILREGVPFKREDFVYHLKQHGIDSRNLFLSMPTQCPGFHFLGYKRGDFPEAEYIGRNGLHIGVHQAIKDDDIDYFIQVCESFLSKTFFRGRVLVPDEA